MINRRFRYKKICEESLEAFVDELYIEGDAGWRVVSAFPDGAYFIAILEREVV